MTRKYDLIGDIHGHASQLRALLERLGYRECDGVWSHPERQVIFLGDFVDRGPEQVETVRIARAMVEAGSALAVMGNHEFNAVGFGTPDPDQPETYLRPHTDKNRDQHQFFLDEVGEGSPEHHAILDWFRTLPLYLDLPGLRVVHACWHPDHLAALDPWLTETGALTAAGWVEAHRKGSSLYEAVEVVLKGQEVELPAGFSFRDKYQVERTSARLRWWADGAQGYRELAMVPDQRLRAELPDDPVPPGLLPPTDDPRPVFFGHYWFRGEPAPLTPRAACLDYSIATDRADRKLVAYRWDGETELEADRFIWV
ncbi:metallophosphoesterase [Thiohalospira sp.]|uniref:metallophosphoesterase n=1 Tax=Thiohalospira sp. TaxID=3080549 RepID=UPI0039808237